MAGTCRTDKSAPVSEATNRNLTWAVAVTKSATRSECRSQPPVVPGPVGPTVSALVQVLPLSLEMSTVKTSVPGAEPLSLEYHRQ
jgi:hypothetical protein